MYEDTNKPAWLCDYDPNLVWGENRKIFDPIVEFYNRKDKPDFIKGRADWIEIFSNGTVQSRIRDTAKFKSNFSFKNFHSINKFLNLSFILNFLFQELYLNQID